MENNTTISRRTFLKRSMAAGGAMMASSLLPAGVFGTENKQEAQGEYVDELLQDVCDIHLHCAPTARYG